jgi:hypothetical protein
MRVGGGHQNCARPARCGALAAPHEEDKTGHGHTCFHLRPVHFTGSPASGARKDGCQAEQPGLLGQFRRLDLHEVTRRRDG